MSVPYQFATSRNKAREEIQRILQRFGCDSVGFMERFTDKTLLLAFTYRGRAVQLQASASGWAALYLKENPWTPRRKKTREKWERAALDQGMIAVNSILRDWVKGQVTAIESGVLTFDSVFLPYFLTAQGDTLHDRLSCSTGQLHKLLGPAPES